jgi:hypothetical protein
MSITLCPSLMGDLLYMGELGSKQRNEPISETEPKV